MIKLLTFITVVLICCFLISVTVLHSQQWYKISAQIDTETLNDIVVINDSIIIAVGDLGVIKRSTDFGESWETVRGKYNLANLSSIDYFDKIIFAVGKNGTIISSIDLGQNWSSVEFIDNVELKSISCYNKCGIIVGNNGFISVTNNEGKDWQKVNSGFEITLNDVLFLDSNTVIAIGNNGLVIKSTNQGLDWDKIVIGIESNLRCLSKNNSNKLVVAGEKSTIILSDDFFNSWEQVKSNKIPSTINSIIFVNDTVLLAGYLFDKVIPYQCFSTNLGNDWTISGWSDVPNSAYAIDKNRKTSYLSGINGTIIKISIENDLNTGNFRFFLNTRTKGPSKYQFNQISGYKTDVLIGIEYQNIVSSIDSGLTWVSLLKNNNGHLFISAYAISEVDYIVLEDSSVFINKDGKSYDEHYSFVTTTTDGGKNWFTQKISDEVMYINKLSFKNLAYIVAFGSDKFYFVSTDNGKSWVKHIAPNNFLIKELIVINTDVIYLMDSEKHLCKTFDNGDHWEIINVELEGQGFPFIHFLDYDTGWLVLYSKFFNNNNKIFKTTDGGISWRNQFDSLLNNSRALGDLQFVNKDIGLCLSNQGLLLSTSDGGENWYPTFYKNDGLLDGEGNLYCPNESILFLTDGYSIYRKIDSNLTYIVNDKKNFYNNSTIDIFPNPASEYIELNVGARHAVPVRNEQIQIFDVYGEQMYNNVGAHCNVPLRIDVSGFPDGMYFLKLSESNRIYKFVVIK